MNTQKNLWLNALRGIGSLIVILSHLGAISNNYGIYFNGCGKIGVWLLMVLSGFWFMYPLEKHAKKFTKKNLINYCIRKIIRLYPPYFCAVLFSALIQYIKNISVLRDHLFFVESYGHFWYMPVIFKFFLIAPFFWLLKNLLSSDKRLVISLSVIALTFAVLFPYPQYIENSTYLYWYVSVFILGMILSIIYYKLETDTVVCHWGDLVAILSLVAILLMTPLFRQIIWGFEPSRYLQNKYLIIGSLWCICILSIKIGVYWKKALAKCRILQIVGDISYPLYLLHYPIIKVCNMMKIPWSCKTILSLVLSFVFAWLFHRYIENTICYKK